MAEKIIRQYGLWESPITPRSLAGNLRLEAARWDSDGQTLLWLEGRSGRGVLVAQRTDGEAPRDLTSELSVRAEVGYGGGDFTVHGGFVYFVVHKTGRIFRQSLAGGSAVPITPAFGKAASPVVSPNGKWIAYVHHDDEQNDRIAVVDTAGTRWPQILASGNDFYMQPRWSPDGRQFCWIAWDHPNMPWDGTTLSLSSVEENDDQLPRLGEPQIVAGGKETALFQPEFTPDGRQLLYVSDEQGWGRLVVRDLQTGEERPLTPVGVELGTPAWGQDMRTYAVTHDGRYAVVAQSNAGFVRIHQIDLETGRSEPVHALAEYTEVAQPVAAPTDERVVFVGSAPRLPRRIVEYNFVSGKPRVVVRAAGETVPAEGLADCEAVSWTTADGETAHGLFYAPASDRFQGLGRPPLIALIHGGPTSQSKAAWSADAQFFATRGYAVLYVNYRGSTGYGREYMLRLRGHWGICDVEDALSGTRHLAETGKIDPERTVIMGGSAGGFTVLHTLCTHPEGFTAGVSLYGVANQFDLASETHKFESRYLDSMLGPLPEAADKYQERSPELHADQIRRPLAIFQGDIDQVVPRAQSDAIAAALKKSGTPHIYHVYEGEGHGWRKQETIEHFYQAVDDFLRKYVIFT